LLCHPRMYDGDNTTGRRRLKIIRLAYTFILQHVRNQVLILRNAENDNLLLWIYKNAIEFFLNLE